MAAHSTPATGKSIDIKLKPLRDDLKEFKKTLKALVVKLIAIEKKIDQTRRRQLSI